jgi:DMSO/TMAO reductase YedYZ molybdopterin-dependent catalytic subunit
LFDGESLIHAEMGRAHKENRRGLFPRAQGSYVGPTRTTLGSTMLGKDRMSHDPTRLQKMLEPHRPVRRIPLAPHQWTAETTPEPDVFVLSHLGTPIVDPAAWSLEIGGLVKHPRRFGLDDIRRMPKRTVRSVHQCAGYPREPARATRRLANVVWGGVDLAALLAELEIDPRARFLWAEGLDHGEFEGVRQASYVKDMPLTRLAKGGVLLAYELNGALLSPDHGFPLRLVVPGYYGTNLVKWLRRLTLAAERPGGYFTTVLYNDAVPPSAEWPDGARPIWAMAPESGIVSPAADAVLAPAKTRIWGRAWAEAGVARVEVSADAGKTWRAAALDARDEWSWQTFDIDWTPPAPGPYVLQSRAVDMRGTVQPAEGARNSIYSVPVTIMPA